MPLTLEVEDEDDGRWIAEVADSAGVLAYRRTRQEAIDRAQALAGRVLADRAAHGEPAGHHPQTLRGIAMDSVALPPSDKQVAVDALGRLPESATLDQISDELALLAAIRRGEAAADAGRVVSHTEVERRSATWTSK